MERHHHRRYFSRHVHSLFLLLVLTVLLHLLQPIKDGKNHVALGASRNSLTPLLQPPGFQIVFLLLFPSVTILQNLYLFIIDPCRICFTDQRILSVGCLRPQTPQPVVDPLTFGFGSTVTGILTSSRSDTQDLRCNRLVPAFAELFWKNSKSYYVGLVHRRRRTEHMPQDSMSHVWHV